MSTDDPIKFDAPRKQPFRMGAITTVDAETGEVVDVKRNAGTLLPCAPDVCQECAVDHPHHHPHNQQSMYYQMQFHAKHGRWPTWSDAMAHCTPEMRAHTREALIKVLKSHGMEIPADLSDEPTLTTGR